MTVIKYFITVIFFNTVGEPVILEGWHPMEVPTLERCEAGAENANGYLGTLMKDGIIPTEYTGFEVICDIKQYQEISFG
jgi:hypothetical protein